jgi:hypothetical protein
MICTLLNQVLSKPHTRQYYYRHSALTTTTTLAWRMSACAVEQGPHRPPLSTPRCPRTPRHPAYPSSSEVRKKDKVHTKKSTKDHHEPHPTATIVSPGYIRTSNDRYSRNVAPCSSSNSCTFVDTAPDQTLASDLVVVLYMGGKKSGPRRSSTVPVTPAATSW